MTESETIVEYTIDKAALNDYPRRLVSPPAPSTCCAIEMRALGKIHCQYDRPFIYKQCRRCGYTVRLFFSVRRVGFLEFLARRSHFPERERPLADEWNSAS